MRFVNANLDYLWKKRKPQDLINNKNQFLYAFKQKIRQIPMIIPIQLMIIKNQLKYLKKAFSKTFQKKGVRRGYREILKPLV